MARRLLILVVGIVAMVAAALWFLYSGPAPAPPPPAEAPSNSIVAVAPVTPVPAPALRTEPLGPAPVLPTERACLDDPTFAAAALANAGSSRSRVASPMGREETGWEIYAPLAAHEIGTACGPDSSGFAAALATWQSAHRLAATGTMEPDTLEALRIVWHTRRPFVAATRKGQCPAAPDETTLALTGKGEGYGRQIMLRPAALEAWRRMVAAARAERGEIAADPRLFTIFSGFRGPAEEAARCAGGGCSTPARASCSAHRTGLALDLYLGEAPGFRPESSADPNRLYLSRSVAYRWLVDNAARFGFSPYAFEPWHWELTGEALLGPDPDFRPRPASPPPASPVSRPPG